MLRLNPDMASHLRYQEVGRLPLAYGPEIC